MADEKEEGGKPEQYPHLKYLKADYIKELCEQNGLDLSLLKTNEERIKALQTVPDLHDITVKARSVQTVYELKGFHSLGVTDDIECYLSTFERLGLGQEIPRTRWPLLLESCLTGKAQRAFHVLTEDQKKDYAIIKDAVLAAYKLTPDAYREKFRSASKLSSETFRQYGNRLNLYLRRWVCPTDELLSIPDFVKITDKLVVDQLIDSLRDESLRVKLLEQRWSNLEDLTNIADNLMVVRASCRSRQQREERSVVSGSSIAHMTNTLPQEAQHQPQEQTSTYIPPSRQMGVSQERRPSNALSSVRCYVCNGYGHLSYACPNSSNQSVNLIRLSTETRHEELCPLESELYDKSATDLCKLDGTYFEATLNAGKIFAYADSGAARSFVHPIVVDPCDYFFGATPYLFTFGQYTFSYYW
ncbi:hypothetical protein HOLleu_17206 [Holothuria leucospilota]|uniref:CCHC-type domain-containing protein n=1 Tax=Holothuria leucospilota TaxID=206669 RepID=A0A9Q1C6T3_HOLLE|nr:hypothetical protein HOLleu_17206 [Holothuria leucospilota]